MIKKFLKKKLEIRRNKYFIKSMNSVYSKMNNTVNKDNKVNNKDVVILLPFVDVVSGGITSILRLASGLSKKGYNIYYYSTVNQSSEELDVALKKNFDYKGSIIQKDYFDNHKNSIIIATHNQTVFVASQLEGYKLYFVQDFEPFFYPVGDEYYMALKSYSMGLHVVSLGNWNIKQIIKHVDNVDMEKLDYVSFPFEPKEYDINMKLREKQELKKIKIAVYSRSATPRRMVGLQSYVLSNLKEKFKNDGIELDIYYFGDTYKFDNGTNLGVASKSMLRELYTNCDIGMVFSATNISLVPYEMIASGLTFIDFEFSSAKDFIQSEGIYYYNGSIDELYLKLKHDLDNPDIINNNLQSLQNEISKLSWDNTIDEFDDILKRITVKNG